MSPIMRKTIDNVNYKAEAGGDTLLELVHAVMHLARSQQYQVLRNGPQEITHMESKVLGFFGRHPGGTQSDLALHSGRDKAQLARLIKGLRERGLLDSVADAADKRNLRLTLTAAGQALQATLAQQARQLGARAVTGFSPAERSQLQALLQRLQFNLGASSED